MGVAAQYIHGARVCIIPRPENNWRPLALRHRPLALVSTLLLIAKTLALGLVSLMPVPAELSTITTARIVQLTNAERAEAGLPALTLNAALSAAAAAKAKDMLEHDYFAHISPAGVTPWFWIHNAQYSYQLAGENLAIDFHEAEDVVAAWMASPSHKENLLHAGYLETGVGVLTGEFEGSTSTVVVHLFGKPETALAASAPAVVPAAEPEAAAPPAPAPAVLAVADTTAPAVPSLSGEAQIGAEMLLRLAGEASSRVTVLVNNQVRSTFVVPESGTHDVTIPLPDIPDGDVVLRAYAQDAAGNRSELSDPYITHKDTQGPQVGLEAVMFIVSPATDRPEALARIADPAIATLDAALLSLTTPGARLTARDEWGNANTLEIASLLPSFSAEADTSYLTSPARFSAGVRRITLVTALLVAMLLSAAVVIRIRVQHPGMIMHAIFVLALSTALLTL